MPRAADISQNLIMRWHFFLSLLLYMLLSLASAFSAELTPGFHDFTESGLTYSLFIPTTSAHILLVTLHGSGESSHGYIRNWEREAPVHGLTVLAPQAMNRNAWQGKDISAIMQETIYLKKTVAAKKTIIAGASAGGHIALLLGVDYPDIFDGTVTFMGTISESMLPYFKFSEIKSDRHPILMIHGEKDPMIPINFGRKTWEFLKSKGYPVTFKAYPEMKHEHYQPANPTIVQWINDLK